MYHNRSDLILGKLSTGLYVACYRGDYYRDLGLRTDRKIKTSKNGETYEWSDPKGNKVCSAFNCNLFILVADIISGKFERDKGKKILGFNKTAFKKGYKEGKIKCYN